MKNLMVFLPANKNICSALTRCIYLSMTRAVCCKRHKKAVRPALVECSMPTLGRGSMPTLARGSMPTSARGSMPHMGKRQMPTLTRGSVPMSAKWCKMHLFNIGRQQLAQLKYQRRPIAVMFIGIDTSKPCRQNLSSPGSSPWCLKFWRLGETMSF